MKCKSCGGEINLTTMKCPYCGTYSGEKNKSRGRIPGTVVLQDSLTVPYEVRLTLNDTYGMAMLKRAFAEKLIKQIEPYITVDVRESLDPLGDLIAKGKITIVEDM